MCDQEWDIRLITCEYDSSVHIHLAGTIHSVGGVLISLRSMTGQHLYDNPRYKILSVDIPILESA